MSYLIISKKQRMQQDLQMGLLSTVERLLLEAQMNRKEEVILECMMARLATSPVSIMTRGSTQIAYTISMVFVTMDPMQVNFLAYCANNIIILRTFQCPYRHSDVARNPHTLLCLLWSNNNGCTNVHCPRRHPGQNLHYLSKSMIWNY